MHHRSRKAAARHARALVPSIIVDRSDLFRAGLVHCLAGTAYRLRAERATLAEVPGQISNACGEGLLILGLDNTTVIDLSPLREMKERCPGLRVLGLADDLRLERLLEALAAGADSYLARRDITGEVLLHALDLMFSGNAVLPVQFSDGVRAGLLHRAVCDRAADPPEPEAGPPESSHLHSTAREPACLQARLSARERDILDRLTRGASNKLIARDLCVAESTVKVHLKALLRKIRVQNRTQAAMWAVNNISSEISAGTQRNQDGGRALLGAAQDAEAKHATGRGDGLERHSAAAPGPVSLGGVGRGAVQALLENTRS